MSGPPTSTDICAGRWTSSSPDVRRGHVSGMAHLNDAPTHRTFADSIVKQPPASLFRATPGTATDLQAHIIAPCLVRPQGLPVFLFLNLPEGRAERQGVSPRPRRHVRAHGSVCPKSTRQTQPRTRLNARVPHANGLCGLLHVPGVVTGADAPPFVRAVARTCTWTVRPSRRRLSLSASRISRPSTCVRGPAS